MKIISLTAAMGSKAVEEFKEFLDALKSIRAREIKQLSTEIDILNAYEMLTKYQRGKLYRSIDARLKWLKALNLKTCILETHLPCVLFLLERLQKSESETIKRSLSQHIE